MLSSSTRHILKRPVARASASCRDLSSYYGGGGGSSYSGSSNNNHNNNNDDAAIRAYPQYSVFGENCVLALKLLPPTLQVLKSRTLVVEKKGRLLLEWNPRAADGSVIREKQIRFGLSSEEVGLVLHQLPEHQVELTRQPPRNSNDFSAVSQPSGVTKVLTLTPQGGGVVTFKMQLDDSDGSYVPHPTGGNARAMEVAVQLGEYQVMRHLMLSSIPVLVGWQQQVEIALQRSIDSARRGPGQGHSSSNYSSMNDVPF
jgi:Whirly transcription factor